MEDLLWTALLAARLLPTVVFSPACGGKALPLLARLGLVAVLALALQPRTSPSLPPPGGAPFLLALVGEIALGAALAFFASCVFAACETAGRLLDELAGSGRIGVFAPAGEQRGPLELLHLMLAVLFFFSLDGPRSWLLALRGSLLSFPLVGAFPPERLTDAAVQALKFSAAALQGGLGMALPAAAAVVCADLLLGAAGRLAPALPLYFLGLPLKTALVLAAAAVSLPAGLELVNELSV